MKNAVITLSTLGLLCGVCAAAEPPQPPADTGSAADAGALASNTEKINYSLGYQLGKDLKGQELELSMEALRRGAEDALSGARPQIGKRAMQAALKEVKTLRSQESLERSLAFLDDNAKKEGVETLASGLQYRVLQAGEGETPTAKSKVTVHYRGTLIDGTEFDSSHERGKPSTFEVKKVIKGWAEGLQLMKEGAKWELFIPPDLAYGARSPRDRFPPNSALIFEVELISVDEAPPAPREGSARP